MALTGNNNYFEDFQPGQLIRHARGKTMCEQDNVGITLQVLNTAEAHFNEDIMQQNAPAGPAGTQRVQFGGVTISMIIGLAMQDTGENALTELQAGQNPPEVTGFPWRHAVRLQRSAGNPGRRVERRRMCGIQTLWSESGRQGGVRRRTHRITETQEFR